MAVLNVISPDGERATMTRRRFEAVQDRGWRLAEPAAVVADTDGTVPAVLDEVGADPVKAAAAIDLEQAGKNRSTLIAKLQAVVDGSTPGDQPNPSEED